MNSPALKIKERLSIEEVVSSYLRLERAGTNLKAKCPFHNEKTPSFFVSPARGSYYCFGCGASGDIFTFVEEFEGLDFKGALKLLALRAGVPLEKYTKEKKEAESQKERLYRVMEEATVFFESNLNSAQDEAKQAREYLHSRGMTAETIKDFRIGLAILDWRQLVGHLKSKNFTEQEILLAGLAKRPEDLQKPIYDRFRGRTMFPIADSSSRIIAFSGRLLKDDEKSAKYLNSPETPIFNKSSILFGIDKAKDSIRKNDFSILVEGQIDLVLSHQAGFKNTIASSGTAVASGIVSKENMINNLGLVFRLSKNIVLAFDADEAGIRASSRFAKIALALGMDVKVAQIPEGVDPADIIAKQGKDAWREAIRNSKHFIVFMLEKILKDSSSDGRKIGRDIRDRLLPFVNDLESAIEKSHFITLISNKSGIPERALLDDLKKVESELKEDKEETEVARAGSEQKIRKDPIERRLLGIAFWQENVTEPLIDPASIFAKLEKVKGKYENQKEDLIYEAEVFYSDSINLQKDVKEMLLSLEEEYLNEELASKMTDLRKNKDPEEERKILQEIDKINKKKEEIKNSRSNTNK